MRQCIFVIGTTEQVPELAPLLVCAKAGGLKFSVWATAEQRVNPELAESGVKSSIVTPKRPAPGSYVAKIFYWVPVTAYRFYNYVHGVRMWTTKSPLVVVQGNSLSTWLASLAGRWGGGQLVHLQHTAASPPAQRRIMKKARFAFCDADESATRSRRFPGCTVVGVDVNDAETPRSIVESLLRWSGGKSASNG